MCQRPSVTPLIPELQPPLGWKWATTLEYVKTPQQFRKEPEEYSTPLNGGKQNNIIPHKYGQDTGICIVSFTIRLSRECTRLQNIITCSPGPVSDVNSPHNAARLKRLLQCRSGQGFVVWISLWSSLRQHGVPWKGPVRL